MQTSEEMTEEQYLDALEEAYETLNAPVAILNEVIRHRPNNRTIKTACYLISTGHDLIETEK